MPKRMRCAPVVVQFGEVSQNYNELLAHEGKMLSVIRESSGQPARCLMDTHGQRSSRM